MCIFYTISSQKQGQFIAFIEMLISIVLYIRMDAAAYTLRQLTVHIHSYEYLCFLELMVLNDHILELVF